MARPRKINEDLCVELAGYFENGLNDREACERAGISRATYYNWMKKGKVNQWGIYSFLYTCVTHAKEMRDLRSLNNFIQWKFGKKL